MRFPSISFGREWKELHRFKDLEQSERSIVFYAESTASMVHFSPIIYELTKNFGRTICYVTSSPNDPVLTTKNDKILSFYIGAGSARTKFFIFLKADVLVMDMPDLELFHIKRSKVYPVHYIYVFHSMFSVHSYLRKGAVDHFDTILCVGPHHINEIRATEAVYGLKAKNLIEYGYGRLDTLMEEGSHIQQITNRVHDKKHVLIAPSYGPKNLLESLGHEIADVLLKAGYRVTVRPHPITTRKSPSIIKTLEDKFQRNSNFILETDISSYDSFFSSHCMISDWSGVALEYAFALERPVVFVDVPKKINNPNFGDISCEPIEIKIRTKIGMVVQPDQLDKIPNMIESLYENLDGMRKQIQSARSQTVFNIGKAGKAGAKHIAQIADECKNRKILK